MINKEMNQIKGFLLQFKNWMHISREHVCHDLLYEFHFAVK